MPKNFIKAFLTREHMEFIKRVRDVEDVGFNKALEMLIDLGAASYRELGVFREDMGVSFAIKGDCENGNVEE